MEYEKLHRAKKADLIAYLIPLIELSVKINECWVDGRDGEHPTDKEFEPDFKVLELWPALRDLHDDYGDFRLKVPNKEVSGS